MDRPRIDHLVVAATSLEQGADWCERTLGVPAGPGGEHPLMGTHNRLLRIATVDHPRTYFEIIARNPAAPGPARGRRWYDLDDEGLQASLQSSGPRLVHWVLEVPDVQASIRALAALGIDRGPAVPVSRDTPTGLLQWQISVRPDGQRLFDGCLPTLIQWGDRHPAGGMPASGVTFHGLSLLHPEAERLARALDALGVEDVPVSAGPRARITARLQTPSGAVQLTSD